MDEICQISPWNLPDFMKFAWFHEICQISWNSPDFMKSARFHHEICRISWYTTECCIFHQNQYRYTLWAYYMLNMQCISPCHEICQISPWNLLDFTMKSARFHHEICQISWYTTECCIFHQNQYRYTLWAYYMLNMQCISPCHEICRISWSTTECCIFHQNQYRYTLLAHLGCKNANFHGLPLNPVFFIRTNTDIHEWAYYMLNMQCI